MLPFTESIFFPNFSEISKKFNNYTFLPNCFPTHKAFANLFTLLITLFEKNKNNVKMKNIYNLKNYGIFADIN